MGKAKFLYDDFRILIGIDINLYNFRKKHGYPREHLYQVYIIFTIINSCMYLCIYVCMFFSRSLSLCLFAFVSLSLSL